MLRDDMTIAVSGKLADWLDAIAATGRYGETAEEVALTFIRAGARNSGVEPAKHEDGPPPDWSIPPS